MIGRPPAAAAARRMTVAADSSSRQRRRKGKRMSSSWGLWLVVALALVLVLARAPAASARTALDTDGASAAPSWADPDYTLYLTASQLLSRAKAVAKAHPTTVRRAVARAYDGDYGANVTVLVVEPGGLRDPPPLTNTQAEQRARVATEVQRLASDGKPPTAAAEMSNASSVPFGVYVPPLRSDGDRVRVLMDFGQHGREFITSEVGLRLLEVLAASGSDNPDRSAADAALAAAAGTTTTSPRFRRLRAVLDRLSLVILPLENEGGRARVEAGARCERKNGRGVDPNRNWPVDWGKKEPDYDPSEEFPGRGPGSEPETRVVRALADQLKPHAWVNVHSGMQALFTAYDHVARVPQGPAAKAALALLARLNRRACNGECAVGSGGKSVGYLAHGTATDHMYSSEGVPLAFTWEIYGDDAADFNDCFRMFNPLGKKAFDRVVGAWVKASLSALELLPTHPAVAPLFSSAAVGKETHALFASAVDGTKEPEEAAEAAEAEAKAAALQAESAKAEEREKERQGFAVEHRGKPSASQQQQQQQQQQRPAAEAGTVAAAGVAATAGGGSGTRGGRDGSGNDATAAPSTPPSSSSSSPSTSSSSSPAAAALPRRMGPQRQQLLVSSGGAGGAAGALGIAAAGAGARLFAVLPLLVVCGAVAALGVVFLARRRRAAGGQGGYLPTALVDLDEGGFGFGPVGAPPSGVAAGGGAGGGVGRARPAAAGGLSLVGVVGRRP